MQIILLFQVQKSQKLTKWDTNIIKYDAFGFKGLQEYSVLFLLRMRRTITSSHLYTYYPIH